MQIAKTRFITTLIAWLDEHQITAVLFDLDGTLINRDNAIKRWAASFVRATFRSENESNFNELVAFILDLDADGRGSKTAMFAEIKKRAPWLRDDVASLVNAFREQLLSYIVLDTDAEHLLDALSVASIPFGIVTNGSSHQLGKIRQLDLEQLTTCIFISEFFGCKKPNPAIFLAAASCLKTKPQNILFVGDDLISDIAGASSVGMKTVWLHRGRKWSIPKVKPDFVLGSLGELFEKEGIPNA